MAWLVFLLLSLLLVAPGWAAGPEHQQQPLQRDTYVVMAWRGVSLQLPRTNNAGAPSYTDGRWWWSPVDPEHPEFKQRRGGVESYICEREQI